MAKDLTSFNSGFLDALLLDNDNSPFDYKGFVATSHYSQDHIDYDTTNTLSTGFAQTAQIEIPQGEYIVGKVQLTFDVSAITQTGGTYVRLHDFGAYHCIDNITCKYGNVDQINPAIELDDLLVRYNLHYPEEERFHVDSNIAGNMSQSERETAAASIQSFLVELPIPWDNSPDMYLNMNTLNKPLIWKIKFKAIADCVETDATAANVSGTISNVKLRVFHYTQPDHILKRQTSAYSSKINEHGIIKKNLYTEKIVERTLTGGTGALTHEVSLTEIKGNVVYFVFMIRKKSNISAGTVNQDYLTWVDIDSWELYDGQNLVIRSIDSQYNRMYLFPHWFEGIPGNYLFGYCYTMSLNPAHSLGHLNHGAFKTPKLKITLNSALSVDHRIDVFAFSHQFYQQKDDTIRPTFE